MKKNLAKTYDPKQFEDRIYREWESRNAFRAEIDRDKKPFTIVMPPPNITGQLHMGHALDQTLQDVLTRWKRMQGYSALWLPGSDHASIATEVKVVNRLREEEGKEKEEIGREAFLERAWDWKREFGGKITQQCRRLGDSCDWSRERFTMDEGCNRAVRAFFVRLYKKGLIYRGNRLINWCPQCGTSLSDAEVEHEDKNGKYWYFRYPGADGGDGIVVATSRPETMFGDVAIAVHPEDERYRDLVGSKVILPLVNREIPVIADPYPDPEKGTGAVKITPAHDPNDFEVGERHQLEQLSCINEDATMNELAGKYAGMDRYECRRAWVADLEAAGYLEKIEELTIPVGECYRCHTVVEPMLSEQWFVKMEELAKPAMEVARDGRLQHVPARFNKTYLQWLENIHDWCISRQLWWGHRIPAWYCDDCGEVIVSEEDPTVCPSCGSRHLHQDEDVLDTWFSSALWPFSTLGWPEKTEDFEYFYPTSVLVTGYDIIFFWVVRMVFAAMETTGEPPFRYVYVHGLVRDAQGRKMSKSLGNGIDPLAVIDEYGADALRFMLTTGITPGNDMRFSEDKLAAARNFANKLWNASRFVIMNLQDEDGSFLPLAAEDTAALRDEDKWILSTINEAVGGITGHLDRFDLALAGQQVYDLIWNEYCDWYIEIVKDRLYGDDEEDKAVARMVLVHALKDLLRLLHPFMPFITEEIWSYLPRLASDSDEDPDHFLIHERWPRRREELHWPQETRRLETAKAVVRAIRGIRVDAEAAPSRRLTVRVLAEGETREDIAATARTIEGLGNISRLDFLDDKAGIGDDVMSAVIPGAEIFVPLADLVDFAAERDRLRKEKKKLEGEVTRCEKMLSNPGFVSKAPARKIEEEREKKARYEEMLAKVSERLEMVERQLS
ncbi:MAG: valine--tRNA ligase [Anaerovoracaceae bacterium]|jgi:valyl-tRNA synthetase